MGNRKQIEVRDILCMIADHVVYLQHSNVCNA